ncbi:hypothetical protein KL918_004010 [Ogataea parapolymorpha]|uniref:Ribonuclease H2 subunit B wHTH domain-containing protein n=1 Tax=Ogataea parapolymorpha (strain ATCC 26012 / BCRC 20466 / JCM 22074 / NRRL Y-7560 / DL-1) TaxID=871575 RepID=W1QCI4_OGAPD|nr:hypothetical protein HPODL_03877 [Ogataea parapolymorpha DL-1]ESW98244.1 hypothetical protein HPODL_03877 [Ogataea parapolymorpha DL-1]KAG7866021.1 hypothetical protein KL918_004010 [Ogataea parapolymorpha]KAG7874825.1 hypothetical protein KL916_001069 [Ogataea parapolymorpha]
MTVTTNEDNIRLIVVPGNIQTPFKTIKPYKGFQLVVNDGLVYELNKTNFRDPHNATQKLTKKQQPLKTIFLAALDASMDSLMVGNNCELWIATKYNPVYLLLDFFTDALSREHVRMVSFQDLLEQFEGCETLQELLENGVDLQKPLLQICESVDENDETFYKPSMQKIIGYLSSKVNHLAQNLPSALVASAKKKLALPGFEPTDEVLQVSKKQLAIELISSYVDAKYLNDLKKLYSTEILDSYMVEYKRKEQSTALAEENINTLNGMNAANPKKRKVEKKVVRKEVKKVAVGKGALDGFFKKKV